MVEDLSTLPDLVGSTAPGSLATVALLLDLERVALDCSCCVRVAVVGDLVSASAWKWII